MNPSTGETYSFLSDMSIWDTFRSEFPLLGFFKSKIMQDITWSMLKMYE